MKRLNGMLLCLAIIVLEQGNPSRVLAETIQQQNELPQELRKTIQKVRAACKELNPEMSFNDMQGVLFVTLPGDTSRHVIVDNEGLCGSHMAGANCTNRGCDLTVWREGPGNRWRKIFDEHAHAKFLAIDWETMRLQLIVISIYAGDPRCKPNPSKNHTSGQSCNLIATYGNNRWNWQLIR